MVASAYQTYENNILPLAGGFFDNPLLWDSLFGEPQQGYGRYREPKPNDAPKDYFTSAELLKVFKGHDPGKPIAVHAEDTGSMWATGLDNPGRAEPPNNHGMICTAILKGNADGQKESFIGYQLDADPYSRETLERLSSNPAVKVVTISSLKAINEEGYKTGRLPEADHLTILAAAGNFGADEGASGQMRAASPVHYAPGYLRVGEVDRNGIPSEHSNADGPAFMCENPLTKYTNLAAQFYPTARGLHDFAAAKDGRAYHPAVYAEHFPTANTQRAQTGMTGTSFATPEAGRMVMHYTAGMDGISNYDVIPALLLAAQMAPPPKGPLGQYQQVAQVTNGAGLKYGTMRYGFGVLKESALEQKLQRVWELRNASPETKDGQLSDPQILNPKARVTASAYGNNYILKVADPGAKGTIVNTTLSVAFNREGGYVPLEAVLESPSGTKIPVPLIYKEQLGGREAIAVTPAFFGEKQMEGEWKVSLPDKGNRLVSASLSFATLQAGSPGAKLVDEFKPVKPEQTRQQPFIRRNDPFGFYLN